MGVIQKMKNRTKWICSFPVHWFYKMFFPKPIVKSIEQTLLEIIEKRPSVSRFGDGELDIMIGHNIPFQQYDARLAQKMRDILVTDYKDFFVCLPDVFAGYSHLTPFARKYYNNHLRINRKHWYRLLKKKKEYYCAQITRPYMDFQDKASAGLYFELLKRVWQDRNIVMIEGEKSRLGIGNDLFNSAKNVRRILCPAQNAFAYYDDIIDEVKKVEKDALILLALGPTATAMAYDLYKMGYQAIDIGHVDIEYEWFLMEAIEKIPVKNKYTNEAVGGTVVSNSNDEVYLSQIIAKIGC